MRSQAARYSASYQLDALQRFDPTVAEHLVPLVVAPGPVVLIMTFDRRAPVPRSRSAMTGRRL